MRKLLTILRNAGRNGRTQAELKKILGENPSRVVADMVKSKSSIKSNLGKKLKELRIKDAKGDFVYRLYRQRKK